MLNEKFILPDGRCGKVTRVLKNVVCSDNTQKTLIFVLLPTGEVILHLD